jgi:hypothetical protein
LLWEKPLTNKDKEAIQTLRALLSRNKEFYPTTEQTWKALNQASIWFDKLNAVEDVVVHGIINREKHDRNWVDWV